MTDELNFHTYLNITNESFEIYLFDTSNFNNVYEDKILSNNEEQLDLEILDKFLDKNIFKIEKLIGKFVNNIFLIIESNEIKKIRFGTKKRNYQEKMNLKYLENTLREVRDLFVENYQDQKIMHIEVKNYLINGQNYSSFNEKIKVKNFSLEVEFIFVANNFSSKIEKILEKYQIKINKILSQSFINNTFTSEEVQFSKKICRIINGGNYNEVKIVPKNTTKKGFFERFFQLFN